MKCTQIYVKLLPYNLKDKKNVWKADTVVRAALNTGSLLPQGLENVKKIYMSLALSLGQELSNYCPCCFIPESRLA